jgi:hypothetical protein
MDSTTERKPRFERKPSLIPRGFRITVRDEEVLLAVARYRIARSTHITALIQTAHAGASEQQILRRLEGLYHKRYLSRPPAQLETYRAGAGSRPIAYMLGNRGADLLTRKYGWRRAAVDWTAKARTATRGEIEHAIEITDFMVALDIACRRRGKFAIIYFDEILRELAPQATREAPRPHHWPVSASWQGSAQTLYVIPDRIFGIRDLTRRGDRAIKFFAYERDRGTMPVVRSNLAQSSILRKLIGYGATHRSGLHIAMYGLPNFRVLTEAPGPKRIENMITEGYQRHLSRTYPPGLFLFADRRSLFAADDFLDYGWQDGEGKRHRLID